MSRERFIEYKAGQSFSVKSGDCEWTIDRISGITRITGHPFHGSLRETAIPLNQLEEITLRYADDPKLSVRGFFKFLRAGYELHKKGQLREDSLESPAEGVSVRLTYLDSDRESQEIKFNFSLENSLDEEHRVEMAFRIADAAGLSHGKAYWTQGLGREIHLASQTSPDLEDFGDLSDPQQLEQAVSKALAQRESPPFDPANFKCAYEVSEWDPGRLVVFKRPCKTAAIFLFPFALLILIGPALVAASSFMGWDLGAMNILILSLVSAMFGIPAVFMLFKLMPSTIVFDWSTRMLTLRKLRTTSIPFDAMNQIDLRGRYCDGSGKSGSSRTFACEFKIRYEVDGEVKPKILDLMETDYIEDPDLPFRQGVSLVNELAKALGIEKRIRDYSAKFNTR